MLYIRVQPWLSPDLVELNFDTKQRQKFASESGMAIIPAVFEVHDFIKLSAPMAMLKI